MALEPWYKAVAPRREVHRYRNPHYIQVQTPNPSLNRNAIPQRSQALRKTTLRLAGTVPPEIWDRLGTKLLPILRSGDELNSPRL